MPLKSHLSFNFFWHYIQLVKFNQHFLFHIFLLNISEFRFSYILCIFYSSPSSRLFSFRTSHIIVKNNTKFHLGNLILLNFLDFFCFIRLIGVPLLRYLPDKPAGFHCISSFTWNVLSFLRYQIFDYHDNCNLLIDLMLFGCQAKAMMTIIRFNLYYWNYLNVVLVLSKII